MGYVLRDSAAAAVIGYYTANARYLRAAGQYECARIIQEAEPDTKWVDRRLIILDNRMESGLKIRYQNPSGKCPQKSALTM